MTITTNGEAATKTVGEIHAAMAAVLLELPAVGKDSRNQAQNFNFRSIEGLVDALNPILGKYGIVPRLAHSELLRWDPKAKGYAAVVLNTYHLTAKDGSYVEAQGLGEGHDFGDKAVSKANTQAYKWMLGQTFCVAYSDEADPDSTSNETEHRTSSAARDTQTESRSGAAGARPAAPPADDPHPPLPGKPSLDDRRMANKVWAEALKARDAKVFEQFREQAQANGVPRLKFSDHDEKQTAWIESIRHDF